MNVERCDAYAVHFLQVYDPLATHRSLLDLLEASLMRQVISQSHGVREEPLSGLTSFLGPKTEGIDAGGCQLKSVTIKLLICLPSRDTRHRNSASILQQGKLNRP